MNKRTQALHFQSILLLISMVRKRDNIMARLLFVKSGNIDNAVTNIFDKSLNEVKCIVQNKTIKYLASDLPPIGFACRLTDFTGPEHAVIQLSKVEAQTLGQIESGFYLIEGINPSEISEKVE
jgi:hypothetical protein